MSNRSEEIFVMSVAGLIDLVIGNLFFPIKIDSENWWILVTGGFLSAILLYKFYRGFGRYPFKKYRVTNDKDEKGLIASTNPVFEGKKVGEAYKIKACTNEYAINGRWHAHLGLGKYSVIFRLKVDDVDANERLLRLEVLSHNSQRGDEMLAARDLTSSDFDKADKYKNFHLDLTIWNKHGENDIEVRIQSLGSGGLTVTLDYVHLTRKLF